MHGDPYTDTLGLAALTYAIKLVAVVAPWEAFGGGPIDLISLRFRAPMCSNAQASLEMLLYSKSCY